MQPLKAVILVGGLGTRLRPLTDNKPKPIMPVLNRPYLEHAIAHLSANGIKDIIMAMSYLPDAITDYFGDGSRFGVRITYCVEKEPLGTAGAVRNAYDYLDHTFIVLNGDNVFIELDVNDAWAFHRRKKAQATIFLTQVENPGAFGVVETDEKQRIWAFMEKPLPGTTTSNWINAGGYILEPEVLEYIPEGQHYMFEKGLFPRLLELKQPVYGYHYTGYWLDMGTPGKYFTLNRDLMLGKVDSPAFPEVQRDGIKLGKDVIVDPSAVLTPPVIIGDGSRIGRGAEISGPVVFGRDCRIMDGAQVSDAIIWDNVQIGPDTRVNHSIISSNCKIDRDQVVDGLVYTPSQTTALA